MPKQYDRSAVAALAAAAVPPCAHVRILSDALRSLQSARPLAVLLPNPLGLPASRAPAACRRLISALKSH